ncbi:hypothetical protein GXW83_28525 [Streptacidiphilus sp. PB12-B1b]|uniref:hypothetical protein n=1 Tax=Streptacidiphilus sp. PB12-B1b TaxID=2705012 RepID=UPI0015FC3320|nr:hypothetical protein [Streptacidiphilus sp. PB12-B1b]QMU79065.1 hypothetical protein GXW83_28525 [Streptacidiphilus sp. PB12-B1b]
MMQIQTWFFPADRTSRQISDAVDRQLLQWGAALTVEQMERLAVVIALLRRAVVVGARFVQIEVTVSLNAGNAVTVEMVDRAGNELLSQLLASLDSNTCRWGMESRPNGPGRVLWAAVELRGPSRVSEAAVRLARTSRGRALRRALPAPLERTARRWLAA